jgi:hypothetical protein
MKILLLRNAQTRSNTGHEDLAEAIVRELDGVLYGIGRENYDPEKTVYDLEEDYTPSVIINYGWKAPVPKKTRSFCVLIVTDAYPPTAETPDLISAYKRYFDESRCDLVLCQSIPSLQNIRKLRNAPPSDLLPYCVETSWFKQLTDVDKPLDVCAMLTQDKGIYPNRTKAITSLMKSGLFTFTKKTDKETYLFILQTSKLSLHVANKWGAMCWRPLESAACGAAIFSDPLVGFKEMGFVRGVNYIAHSTDNVVSIAEREIESGRYVEIAKAGHNLVLNRHTTVTRVQELSLILKAVV